MLSRQCPRCAGSLQPPDLWSSRWRCAAHGDVAPLRVLRTHGPTALAEVAGRARVPVWLPHPAPPGWVVTGLSEAGDERTGAVATAVALCGPGPVGGPAELVLVAEQPGVGLGAALAGLPELYGGDLPDGPAEGSVRVGGHPVPLWCAPGTSGDGCAYVGEADGVWLWVLLWPDAASLLLLEPLRLIDMRRHAVPEIVCGAASMRVSPQHAT